MSVRILQGDCREVLKTLPDESVQCCVTSPPYFGLRDYGVNGQIGLEPTPDEYVAELLAVFREVRRVLRDDGTLWLNLGDSYAGSWSGNSMRPRNGGTYGLKPKDLIGIPWRVAFALQADGWWLRQDIIWSKPNPMPESIKDRCAKAHEYMFLLSKSAKYYFDAEAIAERTLDASLARYAYAGEDTRINKGGRYKDAFDAKNKYIGLPTVPDNPQTRNRRSVWTVTTQPFSEAHFATFPPDLIEPCIKAGCPKGGLVLDPFGGAGTTGLVADRLGRRAILIELNPEYAAMATQRIKDDSPLFTEIA